MNFIKDSKWKVGMMAIISLQLSISSCSKSGDTTTPEKPNSKYISKVFEYTPAPGQFINADLGSIASLKDIIGKANQGGLVSLGGFGGYIVFGFDHPIENKEGMDIGIFGNPLTGPKAEWSEPGIVMVMQDLNGNGIPDDGPWLELAGSEYNKPETIKNYKITYYNPKNLTGDIRWVDNQGKEGYILRNGYHPQEYYPKWATNQNEISFTGTLLKNTLADGDVITNKPFAWGYIDNGSEDYKLLQQNAAYAYNSFDISWAVDKDGKAVKLDHINFVKVYTGQNSNGNPYHPDVNNPRSRYLGEISTEIGGAIDLHMELKK